MHFPAIRKGQRVRMCMGAVTRMGMRRALKENLPNQLLIGRHRHPPIQADQGDFKKIRDGLLHWK